MSSISKKKDASLWKVEETLNAFLFKNLYQGPKISAKKIESRVPSQYLKFYEYSSFTFSVAPIHHKCNGQVFKMFSVLDIVKCLSSPI